MRTPAGRGSTYLTQNLGYADDLVVPAQSPEDLQAKAHIISAFCALFLVEINADKMRFFQLPADITTPFALTIHNNKWEPTHIPPRPGVVLPYLGTIYEAAYTGKTELARLGAYLSNAIHAIYHARATPSPKMYTLNASVFPTVLYSLKHLPILPQMLNKFDQAINQFYRHMFKHTHGFPTAMIHAPRAIGGLQQASLAEKTAVAKWSMTIRNLHSVDPITRQATHQLLENATVQHPISLGHDVPIRLPANPPTQHHKSLFTDHLLHHAGARGLSLCRRGTLPDLANTNIPHSLLSKLNPTPPLGQTMVTYPITVYGDIMRAHKRANGLIEIRWHLTHLHHSVQADILPLLPPLPLDNLPLRIAPGQIWSTNGVKSSAYEIIGWEDPHSDWPYLWVQEWQISLPTHNTTKRNRDRLAPSNEHIQPLLHHPRHQNTQRMHYRTLFPDPASANRILSYPCNTTAKFFTGDTCRRILTQFASPTPTFSTPNWDTQWIRSLKLPPSQCHIYATGAWTRSTQPTHLENIIRQNNQPTGTCAITLLPIDWDPHHPTPVTTIQIPKCEQIGIDEAYGADLMAAAIALHLSKYRGLHEQVHTTSQRLLDNMPRLFKSITKPNQAYYDLNSVVLCATQQRGAPFPKRIAANPHTKYQSFWTKHQWGIHIAECTARGVTGQLQCAPHITNTSIDALVIYKDTLPPDHWYWGDKDGGPLGVKPLPYYLHKNDLTDYTTERDRARASLLAKEYPAIKAKPPRTGQITLSHSSSRLSDTGARPLPNKHTTSVSSLTKSSMDAP